MSVVKHFLKRFHVYQFVECTFYDTNTYLKK